jgi:large subunit ribosomal protein L30
MAKATTATSGKPMLKVTRHRSAIGRRYDQEQSLRGLGLSRRGMSKVVEDTPSIRGMINVVKHLVEVEKA